MLTRTLCLSICVSIPTVIIILTDSEQHTMSSEQGTVNGQYIKVEGNSMGQEQRAYQKCVASVLKAGVQFLPLNLRLNLDCDYYCDSLSPTPVPPTFANSDGDGSSNDEDSTQNKQVQFTVTRERAEELVSSLCGVTWKQKSHSWSEVCTAVAALTQTDGNKICEAMQALVAVLKLHSQLTTDRK